MLPALRNRLVLLALVLSHLAVPLPAHFFRLDYHWSARYGQPLSPADLVVAAALLIVLGADLGLVSAWAALAHHWRSTRVVAGAVCLVGWCQIYDPFFLDAWLYGAYRGIQWEYRYFPALSRCGLAALVFLSVAGALSVLTRHGARLTQLSRGALKRESTVRHFQVAHLLMFVSVMSLLLALSVHFHQGPSRQISRRWHYPEHAPLYSAETVMFSGLVLITITLALVWAALSMGRPWLRLGLVAIAAGLLGVAWAYAFTAPSHAHFLLHNALFSAGVAWGQTVLMTGVFLAARHRGYRLTNVSTEGDETQMVVDDPPICYPDVSFILFVCFCSK